MLIPKPTSMTSSKYHFQDAFSKNQFQRRDFQENIFDRLILKAIFQLSGQLQT